MKQFSMYFNLINSLFLFYKRNRYNNPLCIIILQTIYE
jgi:hypothetical protein